MMLNAPIILASWILVGPPLPIFVAMMIVILGLISALRFRLTHKTIALLSVMGLMVIQSIVVVFIMHFQLW